MISRTGVTFCNLVELSKYEEYREKIVGESMKWREKNKYKCPCRGSKRPWQERLVFCDIREILLMVHLGDAKLITENVQF